MKEEALKLADELDMLFPSGLALIGGQASAMIRRLIEELDKYELQTNQNKLQTNQGEPVAWMWQELGRYKWDIGWEKPTNIKIYDSSPLYTKSYTTPQTKPLSDEEIEQFAKRKANQILMDLLMPDVGEPKKIDWNIGCTKQHLVNFARAIEAKVRGEK